MNLILSLFFLLLIGFLIYAIQLLKLGTSKLHGVQTSLQVANSRLNGIIEGSDDLIAALDLKLNFIAFNTRYKNEALRIFKVNLEVGMSFDVLLQRMDEENKLKTLNLWHKAFEGHSFKVIESFKDKHIKNLYFEIHYNPIRDSQGQLIGASHTASNVNQRIKNEQRMSQAKQQLERMVVSLENQNKELLLLKEMMSLLQTTISFQAMLYPISTYIKMILKSTDGAIYLIDKQNPHLFNLGTTWGEPCIRQSHILQSNCLALLRGQIHMVSDEGSDLWCHHVCAFEEKPQAYMCIPLLAEGKKLGFLYIEMHDKDFSNTRLIYFAQILADQIALSFYNIQLRDKLTLQSTHDSLTGLYNRRFFEEYVNQKITEIQEASLSFYILLIDIDYFKTINDSYGHLFGDKVLEKIANHLDKLCHQNDVLCRWGGEEFIMYLNESDAKVAKSKAAKIQDTIRDLIISYDDKPIKPITLSIGIAKYPENGEDLTTVIEKADIAMYEAKTTGRNKIVASYFS